MTLLSFAAWIPFALYYGSERGGFESGAKALIVLSAVIQAITLLSVAGVTAVLWMSHIEKQRKIIGFVSWMGIAVSLLLALLTRGLAGGYWVYSVSLEQNPLLTNIVDVLARVVLPLAFVVSALLLVVPHTREARSTKVLGVAMAAIGFVVAAGLPSQPALVGLATAFAAIVGVRVAASAFERLAS